MRTRIAGGLFVSCRWHSTGLYRPRNKNSRIILNARICCAIKILDLLRIYGCYLLSLIAACGDLTLWMTLFLQKNIRFRRVYKVWMESLPSSLRSFRCNIQIQGLTSFVTLASSSFFSIALSCWLSLSRFIR